jgi:hypothetical protein
MDGVAIRGVTAEGLEKILRPSPWPSLRRYQGLTYLLVLAGPIAPLLFWSRELDPGFAQVAIAMALLLASWLLLIWVQNAAWRTYLRELARTPSGAEADDWFIDAQGVRTEAPSLKWSSPWSGFADVRESATVIHFILTPTLVMVLPKRVVSDEQLAAVRAHIAAARQRGDIKGIAE